MVGGGEGDLDLCGRGAVVVGEVFGLLEREERAAVEREGDLDFGLICYARERVRAAGEG